MQSFVLILGALLVATALVRPVRMRAARRNLLASLAMRNGWTYTPGDPWNLPAEMKGLWLEAWGHDRSCRDVFCVPTQAGAMWLGQYQRQMSSGRHRRSERFAVALIRLSGVYGGMAILPKDEPFAPADPFQRYREACVPKTPDGRQIWAEHRDSECATIRQMAALADELEPFVAVEVHGSTAAIYWPIRQDLDEQVLARLEHTGRRVIEVLGQNPARDSQRLQAARSNGGLPAI